MSALGAARSGYGTGSARLNRLAGSSKDIEDRGQGFRLGLDLLFRSEDVDQRVIRFSGIQLGRGVRFRAPAAYHGRRGRPHFVRRGAAIPYD